MSDNDDTVYKELIGFLKSDRPDVRFAAVASVASIVARDGMDKLIQHGAVPVLTKLTSIPGKTGLHALHALVNLSSNIPILASQCVEDVIDGKGISRASEIALSSSSSSTNENVHITADRIHSAISLLANVTRNERGAVELLGPSTFEKDDSTIGENSKPIMTLLLGRFLSTGETTMTNSKPEGLNDPYQHVAALLMNISQCESGRRFLMKQQYFHDKDEEVKGGEANNGNSNGNDDNNTKTNKTQTAQKSTSHLQSILPQLRSPNKYRRRGVAGAIKNCCFERDSAWWLLNEVCILKHILYPLAGPEQLELDEKTGMDPELWLEGPDKIREPEAEIRLLLVEAILLLCATGRISRNTIRTQKAFVILKLTDMVEENEEVGDKINECVQFLRRDEEGTVEGSSDQLVEDTWKTSLLKSHRTPLLTYEEMKHEEEDFNTMD